MSKSNSEARILEKSEYPIWDKLVESSPQGTIFHTSDWLGICSDTFGGEIKIFGCFSDNDELLGGCSLFVHKYKGIFEIANSTCTMTPYGGFVVGPSGSTKIRKIEQDYFLCMNNLVQSIKNEKYFSTNIINSPDLLDVRPLTWNKWRSRVLYTYYVDLKTFDLNKTSRGIKRDVKHAVESGITIQNIRKAEIHNTLFEKVFERQNLQPPTDITFFNKVIEQLEKNKIGDMWIAKNKSDEIVESLIWLWDNKRAYAWSVASDPNFRDSGVNVFSFYNVLQELGANNIKEVNMMQGNIPRLAEFATKFNPELVPYYSVENNSFALNLSKRIRKDL